MANIGLDATYLSIYGKGTSRYQHNLIKALAKKDKKNCYYIFLNRKNIIPQLPQQENFRYISACIPKRIIWDQVQLPIMARKYKLDIYHSSLDTLPLLSKVKFLLFLFEIPDYRIEQASCGERRYLYAQLSHGYCKFFFPLSLKKAAVIIASSQSTKKDLMDKYNAEEKLIRVVYPASDEVFSPANSEKDLLNTRKKYNAETGYIFHVSSSDPRDNTPTVIHAYHKALPGLNLPKKLIIYGDVDSKRMGLDKLIQDLNLERSAIFIKRFENEEITKLAELYRAADVYVDPSLYEGFGLQVVEAMACGVPVITSDVTSLPEIVGDAGILIEPTDIDGWAAALVRVLTDSGFCQALRQKSLERTKFFSWDKNAEETLAIYDELLAGQ